MSEDVPPYVDSKRQRFNRTNISMHDFEHSIEFIDAIKKHGNEVLEYEALFMAAIITYARPFGPNEKMTSAKSESSLHIDTKTILGPQHILHEKLVKLRNKAVAHAEWDFYPTQQIRVVSRSGGFGTTSKRWHPINEAIDLDAFRDIASKMQKACLDELHRLAVVPQSGELPDEI